MLGSRYDCRCHNRRPAARPPRRRRAAFSVVELLVFLAILGVLVGLLLPAMQRARESARQAHCLNHLFQIGVALHNYHDAHGALPVGCLDKRVPHVNPAGRQLAWSAAILPQLERGDLAARVDWAAAFDDPVNAAAAATTVAVYLCPSAVGLAPGRRDGIVSSLDDSGVDDPVYRAAANDYGGNFGAGQVSPSANGVLLYDQAIRLREVLDGASHTLAVLEDSGRGAAMNGEWINGENIFDVGNPINSQQDNEIWSDHPGGAMLLWCDGHAALVSDAAALPVLRAACTRAGDELPTTEGMP